MKSFGVFFFTFIICAACAYCGFALGYIIGVRDSQQMVDKLMQHVGGHDLEFKGEMPW